MEEVLHVSPTLFDDHGVIMGGAERYAHALAREMAQITPTKLLTFSNQEGRDRDHGLIIEKIRPSAYVRGQRINPISPRALVNAAKARIVHCHQQHILMTTLIGALRKVRRQPTFVTEHGGGGWDISSYINTSRLFTGHLHVSDYSRKLHAPQPNARVIYAGVDLEKFQPSNSEKKGAFLFAGRILPHKGIHVLIEALDEGMQLDVVGRVGDHAYLKYIQELSQGKQVRFYLDVSDEKLQTFYSHAIATVLPSVHQDHLGHYTQVPELFGLTLLESMASGCPVVASDAGALPEVIATKQNGIITPEGNVEELRSALKQMLNPDFRNQLAQAGREHIKTKFSWRAVAQACIDAYRSVT